MDVRVDPIDECNYFSMDSCDGLFGPSVIGLVFFFGDLMEKDPSLGVFFFSVRKSLWSRSAALVRTASQVDMRLMCLKIFNL